MTTFDERKDTFEKKYIHDEQLRFRILSRRNRLLFLWGATQAQAHIAAERVENQAQAFVLSHMRSTEKDILLAMMYFLESHGITYAPQQIRQQMALFWEEAAIAIVESKGSWLQ